MSSWHGSQNRGAACTVPPCWRPQVAACGAGSSAAAAHLEDVALRDIQPGTELAVDQNDRALPAVGCCHLISSAPGDLLHGRREFATPAAHSRRRPKEQQEREEPGTLAPGEHREQGALAGLGSLFGSLRANVAVHVCGVRVLNRGKRSLRRPRGQIWANYCGIVCGEAGTLIYPACHLAAHLKERDCSCICSSPTWPKAWRPPGRAGGGMHGFWTP